MTHLFFRALFSILSLSIFSSTQAQEIHESRNAAESKHESIIYSTYANKYDTVIAYNSTSIWGTERYYYVLVNNDHKWEAFRLEVKFNSQYKTRDHTVKMKEKKISIHNSSVHELLQYWTINNFWNFSSDSVNCKEKVINDSMKLTFIITDAAFDEFEVFTNKKYYRISAYAPDQFQEEIPIIQRQQFILCRNRFYKTMKMD